VTDISAVTPLYCRSAHRLFGQYQHAGKFRRECFSGGKVLEAPSNVVVLIVTSAQNVVVGDSALAVKLMHVIEAATKTAFGHHRFDDKGKLAG